MEEVFPLGFHMDGRRGIRWFAKQAILNTEIDINIPYATLKSKWR